MARPGGVRSAMPKRRRPCSAATGALFAALVVPFRVPHVAAYPDIFLKRENCARTLVAGTWIMGCPAEEVDTLPPITVKRGSTVMNHGDHFKPGDSLTILWEGPQEKWVMEATGSALFTDGACYGTRIAMTQHTILGLPLGDGLENVEIRAGWAAKFGPVSVSKPYILYAPPGGPTPSPTSSSQSSSSTSTSHDKAPGITTGLQSSSLPRLDNKNVMQLDTDSLMELSWKVGDGYVDIQVVGQGTDWVAAGLITGKKVMVSSPAHQVLMFPDESGSWSLRELRAKAPGGVKKVDANASDFEVLQAQQTENYTLLRWRQKGGALDLAAGNALLWAHGMGNWPEMHGNAAGVDVKWGPASAPAATDEASSPSPTPPTGSTTTPPNSSPNAPSGDIGSGSSSTTTITGQRLNNVVNLDTDSPMDLSWTVGDGYVDIQVTGAGNQNWVAAGLVTGGAVNMVVNPPHHVLLYPDDTGGVSMRSLQAQAASGVKKVDIDSDIEVLHTEQTDEHTVLRWRQKGGGLLNVGGSNTVLWAHGGGAWPEVHGNAAGVDVAWGQGTASASKTSDGPLYVPGVILILLPLLVIPFVWTPLRSTGVGNVLLHKRVFGSGHTRPATPRRTEPSALLKLFADVGAWKVGEVAMVVAFWGIMAVLLWHWYTVASGLGKPPRQAAATATGFATLTFLSLISLPSSRTGLWGRITGMPFDRMLKFHRSLGRVTLISAATHLGLAFYQPISFTQQRGVPVITAFGLIAFISLCVVALSAIDIIRRRLFEAFKALHYIALVAVIAAFLHVPVEQYGLPYFFPIIYLAPPAVLFLCEMTFRWLRSSLYAETRSIRALGDDATMIEVAVSPFLSSARHPGAYYFIQIPSISKLEWHSFSVCGEATGSADVSFASAADNSPVLTFCIRSLGPGTWTGRLNELARSVSSEGQGDAHTYGKAPLAVAVQQPVEYVNVKDKDGGSVGAPSSEEMTVGTAHTSMSHLSTQTSSTRPSSASHLSSRFSSTSQVPSDLSHHTSSQRMSHEQLSQPRLGGASSPLPTHIAHSAQQQQLQQQRSYYSNRLMSGRLPDIRVDGPYGRLAVRLEDHRRLLLVAGGIGVTPLIHTLRYIEAEVRDGGLPRLVEVQLVWVVQSSPQLTYFEELLMSCGGTGKKGVVIRGAGGSSMDSGVEMVAATGGHPHHHHQPQQHHYQPPPLDRSPIQSPSEAKEAERGAMAPILEDGGASGSDLNASNEDALIITSRLFVSRARQAGQTGRGIRFEAGRPDVWEVLDSFLSAGDTAKGDVAVLACCRPGMMMDLRNAAIAKGVPLHEEAFYL